MNLTKIVIAVLLVILVLFAAVYLMGRFEQTQPIYNQIMGYVNNAKNYVMSNWQLVAGSVGSIATVGGVAASKLSAAKTQLTQTVDAAKTQTDKLAAEKTQLQQQIASYEAQAKNYTDQTKLAQDAIAKAQSQSNAQIVDLTNMNTSLKNQKIEVQDQYKQLQIRYDELRKLTAVK